MCEREQIKEQTFEIYSRSFAEVLLIDFEKQSNNFVKVLPVQDSLEKFTISR
jgi:hypothetical protein